MTGHTAGGASYEHLPELPDWSGRAPCAGSSAFEALAAEVTEAGMGRSRASRHRAAVLLDQITRSYCGRCPIVGECRDFAAGEERFEGVAAGAMWRESEPRLTSHALPAVEAEAA